MTVFIDSTNINQFAKVQNAASYVQRDDVVLLWDDLSKKQRRVAKNIDIDLTVETSEPDSVPDKWKNNIDQVGDTLDTLDIVKMIIANPARKDVYELLQREKPPEPLVLWWLNHVYSDPDYFQLLADICHYGLFKTDTDYLWATIAFGTEAGVGRFHWPESEKESSTIKNIKSKIAEEQEMDRHEVDKLWDSIKDMAPELAELTEIEYEELGLEPVQEEQEEEEPKTQSSLLDI